MRQTPVWSRLFAVALLGGLLAAFPCPSTGGPTTQINVGGIDFRAPDNTASPGSSRVHDRLQGVNTGPTSPDHSNNKLQGCSQGNKSRNGPRFTTTPTTTSEYGTPGSAGEYGTPTSPPCSQTNITIG